MDRQALITEFQELAAMHEASRQEALATPRKDMLVQAAYFMGRRDQCYSAAGIIAAVGIDSEPVYDHKHSGDTLVNFAGR